MLCDTIKSKISKLVKHDHILLTNRGNTSINTALDLVSKGLLIPAEGGWLTYVDFPKKRGIAFDYVTCNDAKIDLVDLEGKLKTGGFDVLLYHQLGGYFAVQPMKEIYEICQRYNCLVVMDVAGSIGTTHCDGSYADVILGSFGRWKLVNADGGGFISAREKGVFDRLNVDEFTDETQLAIINEKLGGVKERITFLLEKRDKIVADLSQFDICHKDDPGFVVVVKCRSVDEKEKIIAYCSKNKLDHTLCPRYIRVQQDAVSIEVKRLSQ